MTRSGFVLPAVLMLLLLIGVISFAMSLVATLELQAARSAANAVTARAAAQGGLALALAEVMAAAGEGTPPAAPTPPAAAYGPWPAYGLDAVVTLEQVALAGDAGVGEGYGAVYRLAAAASQGRVVATASLEFVLEPELTVLERRR